MRKRQTARCHVAPVPYAVYLDISQAAKDECRSAGDTTVDVGDTRWGKPRRPSHRLTLEYYNNPDSLLWTTEGRIS